MYVLKRKLKADMYKSTKEALHTLTLPVQKSAGYDVPLEVVNFILCI